VKNNGSLVISVLIISFGRGDRSNGAMYGRCVFEKEGGGEGGEEKKCDLSYSAALYVYPMFSRVGLNRTVFIFVYVCVFQKVAESKKREKKKGDMV
jgi:hypothetical protein